MSRAKRWTALAHDVDLSRWTTLAEHVTDRGQPNEFIPWSHPDGALDDLETLRDFDFVRISSQLGPGIAKRLPVRSTWTTMLGVVDGIIRTEHGWWPHCALHEAFGEVLIDLGPHLDRRGGVLIAGAGGGARTAIGAFFKAGFKSFMLTDHDLVRARETIDDVNRRFFGIDLAWTPRERIVTLPAECAAVVNCVGQRDEGGLMNELSYLNFLNRSGYVFDLSPRRAKNTLVTEAVEAGLGLVTGVEIAARSDRLWARWAFGVEVDLARRRGELEDLPADR